MATELPQLTATANAVDCNRGELRLSASELEFINESLRKNQTYFRLDLVAEVGSGSKKQSTKHQHSSPSSTHSPLDPCAVISSSTLPPIGVDSAACSGLRNQSSSSSSFQSGRRRSGESRNSLPSSSTDTVPIGSHSVPKTANSCSTHSGSSSRSTSSSRSEINDESSARKSLVDPPSAAAISTTTSAILGSTAIYDTFPTEGYGAFVNTICAATTATSGAANGELDECEILERWRTLCRSIMVRLCDDTSASLFAVLPFGAMPPTEGALDRLAKDVAPAVPISITDVISKLDTDGYASLVEFVADVDTVWTCAFRSSEPGSTLWMEAHRASVVFRNMLEQEKLLDFVIMPEPRKAKENDAAIVKGSGETESLPESTTGQQQREQSGEEQRRYDEQLVDTEMADHEGDQKDTAGGLGADSSEGGDDQIGAGTIETSTCAEDRKRFQELLGTLTQEQHLQLYDLFQQAAVWKEMPDGVVELDDKRTSVEVFRQMVRWCEGNTEQSAIQPPSSGNPDEPGGPTAHPETTTDEVEI
eukprot:GHVS01076379.1.p1 GENE.GHVS01076379.1~~GHVS01076379.1.p1  ORF type:complete len:533 (+),score=89.17 GHVS01076379.1:364-1962(+)